ncbi:MAG: hypothetical protein VB128_00710 [Sedimentibacter saalensis]|uniref:hypothetical protein n=1 Tax=Sedimentibacter saalensis TaxID=130788 RepID=UPI002B219B7B|nr:hypothetical protein [Sedimentibacter saalensis]MEA5093452.1 hypothetical protein [Sedimentibacter saalensis]
MYELEIQFVVEDYCPPGNIKLLNYNNGRAQDPPLRIDKIDICVESESQFVGEDYCPPENT